MNRISYDEFRTPLPSPRCVYCGEIAQSEEHWPPYSYSHDGYILSACLECNGIAATKFPTNFKARARYVTRRLEEIYADVLYHPKWTLEELDELTGTLRERMLEWHGQRLRLERRIAWNAISYIACIDRGSCFVPTYVARRIIVDESAINSPEPKPRESPRLKRRKSAEEIEFERNLIAEYGYEEGLKIAREVNEMCKV